MDEAQQLDRRCREQRRYSNRLFRRFVVALILCSTILFVQNHAWETQSFLVQFQSTNKHDYLYFEIYKSAKSNNTYNKTKTSNATRAFQKESERWKVTEEENNRPFDQDNDQNYTPTIMDEGEEQKKEVHVSSICQDRPNDGNPDSNTVRYHVLLRLQHLITTMQPENKTNAPKLLCIFPFFPVGRERAAVETYGSECDGVLLLRDHAEPQQQQPEDKKKEGGSFVKTLEISDRHHDTDGQWKQKVMEYLSSQSNNYDWIHWASPRRYSLVGVIRMALQQQEEQLKNTNNSESSVVFQTWDGKGHLLDIKYYQELRTNFQGQCTSAWVWNAPASQYILPTCWDRNNYNNRSFVKEPDIVCRRPNDDKKSTSKCIQAVSSASQNRGWNRLRNFFQIPAALGDDDDTDISQQWHRIHAILHGICDPIWNQYLGAVDDEGRQGYIHDPTFLIQKPPPPLHTILRASLRTPNISNAFNVNHDKGTTVCDLPLGEGDEGPYGAQALLKVRTDWPQPKETVAPPKILCLVYTHEGAHPIQLKAVVDTWGSRCDGLLAASNKTDPSLGAVHIIHEGPEHYGNMWMKVVSMLRYAHQHYLQMFDFFHIGGDDMYVIVENLRHTLTVGNWKGPWNTSEPLMLGGSVAVDPNFRFCGGGAGYTLNRPAVEKFVQAMTSSSNTTTMNPECQQHYESSMEDIFMAQCLFSIAGIQCADTNDDQFEQRYHPYSANYHAKWKPKRFQNPSGNYVLLANERHNITHKPGLGQISQSSVSFHLKQDTGKKSRLREHVFQDKGMRRFHAILYNLCPVDSPLAVSIQKSRNESDSLDDGNKQQ